MSALHNITQKKPRLITHSARLNYGEWIGPSVVAHYHCTKKHRPETRLFWQSFSTRQREREMGGVVMMEERCQ